MSNPHHCYYCQKTEIPYVVLIDGEDVDMCESCYRAYQGGHNQALAEAMDDVSNKIKQRPQPPQDNPLKDIETFRIWFYDPHRGQIKL